MAAAAPPGAAPAPAAPAPARAPRRQIEVRFALSPSAAEELSEVRLRRLLEIELPDSALLAPGAVGPLGDHVAYVWIDRPTQARLDVQVRLDGRAVVRRAIAVAGLTSDVAARLVAIAAAEMVRAEIRRSRAPRRPPVPRGPTPEEIELASRDLAALGLTAGPVGAVITGGPTVVGGVGLGIAVRRLRLTESLFARWLGGSAGDASLRWLEAGLSVDYRLWVSPTWRLSLGAAASIASLNLAGAASVDGLAGEEDTWSTRAGALLGVEAALGGPVWLGLTLEPGFVLRPARYEEAGGAERAIEGAWLGLGLSLTVERQEAPAR